MKTLSSLVRVWLLSVVFVGFVPGLVQGAANAPSISAVRLEGTNVVVTAQVPAGIRKLTLECRPRLSSGNWEPRVLARLDGQGGEIIFRVPAGNAVELMRLRGDATEPLPSAFYSGTNEFVEVDGGSGNRATAGPMDTNGGTTTSTEATREVVESDIWKIRGSTLYFFNQLRGLQAINIANPDEASVRDTLELPAVGEDMYLLGDEHVVLLARDGCAYDHGEVLIVADAGGQLETVARLPVTGVIQESRLVGSALYVAAQSFRVVPGTTSGTWEWGTTVSSIDLSDPLHPVTRSELWLSGYGNVVSATDRLLFVVTQDPANWWQSVVHCLDITNPDGTIQPYQIIRTSGRIADKFKLNLDGSVFTTVSEDWRTVPGRRVTTHLETFRLPDPRSLGPAGVIKLGDLELGRGERLHATRFDGHKVYVVTFFQIDPLWVVDISNPSAPKIAGSVDVPGWSTFIQPWGTRLVTIGIEGSRVAVSLFDVSNPAAPALLSRVRVGENYSWSEANWDEKAFSVLPAAGLILVPFSGDTANGYSSRVQLIDLAVNALTSRGVIEHQFQPRRATLHGDRILSISGWEFLSVDASDRDHPQVRGSIVLAWPVDRVFLQGNFVVELGGASGWSWSAGGDNPILRVATAAAPNQILTELSLGDLPIVGAAKRGQSLYVAQASQGSFYPAIPLDDQADGTPEPIRSKFRLTVVDLNALPAVQILGRVETDVDPLGFGSDWQAVWPKPGLVVFSGGGFNFWFDYGMARLDSASILRWPFYGGSGGRLLAFDVSDGATPRFASDVTLTKDWWWNFSRAFARDGLVYLSHQRSEFLPADPLDPTRPQTGAVGVIAPEPGALGFWISRSYLDVVDYADAKEPVVRKPVNIPGQLRGISHGGGVLYTVGTRWTWTADVPQTWIETLDASAYDGVAAHLIDSLKLPEAWPHPLLVEGTNIFVGRPGTNGNWWGGGPIIAEGPAAGGGTADNLHLLETWYLSDAGKFAQAGKVPLPLPVSTLVSFGDVLAAQLVDNTVALFDARNGAELKPVGRGQPPGCLWFDLTHADAALDRGLWIPLGAYGVATIPVGN